MQVRRYQPGEERELRTLYVNTVRTVNLRDYTPEQVCAWAPDEIDTEMWNARIATMNPFVCVTQEQIVGYAGLLASGYIDHFYVHRDWQRCGIGRLLMEAILAEVQSLSLSALSSDVSITARPFFESQGFHVVAQQTVVRGDVNLTNFRMTRNLCEA